jgi:hypothetical protein
MADRPHRGEAVIQVCPRPGFPDTAEGLVRACVLQCSGGGLDRAFPRPPRRVAPIFHGVHTGTLLPSKKGRDPSGIHRAHSRRIIASDTAGLLRRFAAQLSVGDAAVLLGVSKGRISQLRGGPAGQPTSAARRTGTDG